MKPKCRRPRLLILVAVQIAAIALVAGLLARSPRPPVNVRLSTLCGIVPGMSEEEVRRIIGVPPGDYTTRATFYSESNPRESHRVTERAVEKEWLFNSACVYVWFEDGKAVHVERAGGLRHPTWMERTVGIQLFPIVEPDE